MQRPVHHADAVQVARADHQVVRRRRGHEIGQVVGIVREVGVHLADEVRRPFRDRVLQAVDVGAAEAARPGAVHDLDAARDARPPDDRRSRPSRPATRRRPRAAGSPRAPARRRRAAAGCRVRYTSGRRRGRSSCVFTERCSAEPQRARHNQRGSITGIRNRSCGKNTRPAMTVESAISQSAHRRPSPTPADRQRTDHCAGRAAATYGIADAAKYVAECSAIRRPDRHDRVEELAHLEAEPPSGCRRIQSSASR